MIELIKLNKDGTRHPLFSKGEIFQSKDGLIIKLKEGDRAGHAVLISVEHLPGMVEKANDIIGLALDGMKNENISCM